MANSRYEYVKSFERPDKLLPNTWMVVRIDGRGFTKLCAKYEFEKPNDRRGIDLMNAAAMAVMKDIPDLVLAYGVSDEFSFLFPKECKLFERREGKIVSTVVSTFSAYYVHLWPNYFPEFKLGVPLPSFDGRAVIYPDLVSLRDYFSWRQVDCHINNLYNTVFWSLVLKGGMTAIDAEARLSGTLSAEKNEILFSQFGINYNKEPEINRKGSVIYRQLIPEGSTQLEAKIRSEESHSTETTLESDLPQTDSIGKDSPDKNHGLEKDQAKIQVKNTIKQPPRASKPPNVNSKQSQLKAKKIRQRAPLVISHIDIIQDEFWNQRPWILS